MQRTARTWGDIWHVGGVGALLRDELFRRRPADDYSYTDWLYLSAPSGAARAAGVARRHHRSDPGTPARTCEFTGLRGLGGYPGRMIVAGRLLLAGPR